MLVVALVLPAIIGFVATKVTDPEDQPKGGKEIFQRVLHGYPYTVATSLALIMMVVFVPLLKVRTLAKRWTTEHLPIVVEEQDYLSMVRRDRAGARQGEPAGHTNPGEHPDASADQGADHVAGKGKTNLVADQLDDVALGQAGADPLPVGPGDQRQEVRRSARARDRSRAALVLARRT